MADLTLVIGNKNYSSWSMRPWLVLARAGIDFDEVVIPLDRPESKAAIAAHSPAGRVPVLKHRGATIWDSLAIIEYLAEVLPEAGVWPADAAARARARSVAAEMHAGFSALRKVLPMDVRASRPETPRTPRVDDDIRRVREIWRDCRAEFGADGAFLFGRFCAADAMYAPVVSRFRTYGVELDGPEAAYAAAVWGTPEVQRWAAAAAEEPWTIGNP